jgi:hypothetical protein
MDDDEPDVRHERLSASIVIRGWHQPDGPFCARVGCGLDDGRADSVWQVCVGVEPTLVVVRSWLERFSPFPPRALNPTIDRP